MWNFLVKGLEKNLVESNQDKIKITNLCFYFNQVHFDFSLLLYYISEQ